MRVEFNKDAARTLARSIDGDRDAARVFERIGAEDRDDPAASARAGKHEIELRPAIKVGFTGY